MSDDWDDDGFRVLSREETEAIDKEITLVVTSWPYCGVGGYFCVTLDKKGATEWGRHDEEQGITVSAGRGPFPETQPLVMAIANTYHNKSKFDIGSEHIL